MGEGLKRRILLSGVILGLAGVSIWVWRATNPAPSAPKVADWTSTLVAVEPRIVPIPMGDPFGVALGAHDTLYVTDGRSGTVSEILPAGHSRVIASGLNMPSGLAATSDGRLIVANTGDHTIVSLDPETGESKVVGGKPGEPGFQDGNPQESRFRAPVGVAIAKSGAILVADTYNDAIRSIDLSGVASTIAGPPNTFSTPCGLVEATDRSIIVCDSGHDAIQRIGADGQVATVWRFSKDPVDASEDDASSRFEPLSVALEADGSAVVVGNRSPQIVKVDLHGDTEPTTLAGGASGYKDGPNATAQFSRLAAIAVTAEGWFVVTDPGNSAIRAIVPDNLPMGYLNISQQTKPNLEDYRENLPSAWPYRDSGGRREIAGTFAEIRGERTDAPGDQVWFHYGVDIPGQYGEEVYTLIDEQVVSPFAIQDVGTWRERLRLPVLGYIHLRVGRDARDKSLGALPIEFGNNADGSLRARIPRGTRIPAHSLIGTLNRMNHVHLTVGPLGREVNALSVIAFPGFRDTLAPILEEVRIVRGDGDDVVDSQPDKKRKNQNVIGRTVLRRDERYRVLIRAFDRHDGNAQSRKLGLFKVGFQILDGHGSPVREFHDPDFRLIFETVPNRPDACKLAYAPESRSWSSGPTVFWYEATNVVRSPTAERRYLPLDTLPSGDFILRAVVEDVAGNRSTRDLEFRLDD